MKEKDINSLDHTTRRCQYHIVFAPKHRRMVIYREIKADMEAREAAQKAMIEKNLEASRNAGKRN